MTIEAVVEKYIDLCNMHGLANVKSITPVEYRINAGQHHVIDGAIKLEISTYSGKTIMIEHIDKFSYADNLQTLKAL